MVEPLQAEPWNMVISKEPCARVTPVTWFGGGSDATSLLGSYDLIIHDSTKSSMLVYISTTNWLQFRVSYKHDNEQSLNFLECFHPCWLETNYWYFRGALHLQVHGPAVQGIMLPQMLIPISLMTGRNIPRYVDPCHHSIAKPQVVGGGDSLLIQRVGANILD